MTFVLNKKCSEWDIKNNGSLVYEGEEQILKLCGVVWPVHDVTIVIVIELSLSTELAAEELGRVWNWDRKTVFKQKIKIYILSSLLFAVTDNCNIESWFGE